ncbi:sugar phosphate isomerase/epimerase family protein [Flagellimonas zhangzhouensis]|uniref:Sugar phosphate isomerase/epimerase n=1 Tax=Flagellimonas zhangzhouensis TaxID=1073328 RepID=A0A1H2YN08_9FLAO|nr:sugar phosphate isomerase/epimerase [Allomuricauda zhangzhouensis]SDR01535.1 Sugar phosphate isomerase/epimerase [Allomuricauda zhangzhouensis]SDX06371.1 Sugar phosphate isomerase/epimerase [Allomuricauda zhangzhouensis]
MIRIPFIKKGWLFFLALVFTFCTVQAQQNFGGLALYTLRDNMNSDVESTLQEVADTGYGYVEAAGYAEGKFYGMAPADFNALLKSKGLEPMSTHQRVVDMDETDAMVTAVKEAGFKYFVVPSPPRSLVEVDRETRTMKMKGSLDDFVEFLTELGKKCEKEGIQLLYHNHDMELKVDENGDKPLDYLLEHTDPKYVNFQMDLFWMTRANADPVAYFEKYPGRFKSWHVKDMDQQDRFAPVGQGKIDFKRILDHKEASGMQHFFVEQDRVFDGLEPLEAIKISHKGLKEFGFDKASE